MLDHSSRKYLLLAALSLAVIIGGAYFGRDVHVPVTGQSSGAATEANPLPSPTQPAANPQVADLALPAIEFAATAAPVEKTQPAATPSPNTDNLLTTLTCIEADYSAVAQPILEKSVPVIAPEDRNKLTFLDQEKLADLGKVLTTEELDVYQNTADPTTAPRRR